MYFLADSQGNVVRALSWESDTLTFVLRHDTGRVEAHECLKFLDRNEIQYTILDTVQRKMLDKGGSHPVKSAQGSLTLVREASQVLANVELPKDNEEQFKIYMRRASISGAVAAALLLIFGALLKPQAPVTEEPQVVQVMDRKQIEKAIVLQAAPQRVEPLHKMAKAFVKKAPTKVHKQMKVVQQSGVLGVLGSLKSSSQRGGLKLNQAETSAGIGRGGLEGSGGIQTSAYAKGMFAAPLGTGGKAQGAGGYGTKGKGGGKAGYGQISLIGSGGSFFQPVESDAWVEGGLDRNEIAAVIQRHLSEVRFCYEQGLQQKPNLTGRLSMKFMIGPRGSVTLAQVMNSSLRHIPVENCIRDRLKTWNFPQPQGGVTVKVNYPFILRRVSDS